GLVGSIDHAGRGGADFHGLFSALWLARERLPLVLKPGDAHAFVLQLSPDPAAGPLLPRKAAGVFETPVTLVWSLGSSD
ncbi:unnamed protein product, partial [Discosporangium mesarthrocarpum]